MHIFHKYVLNQRPVGEYDSITGPRTIIEGQCKCGKKSRWTIRGLF